MQSDRVRVDRFWAAPMVDSVYGRQEKDEKDCREESKTSQANRWKEIGEEEDSPQKEVGHKKVCFESDGENKDSRQKENRSEECEC